MSSSKQSISQPQQNSAAPAEKPSPHKGPYVDTSIYRPYEKAMKQGIALRAAEAKEKQAKGVDTAAPISATPPSTRSLPVDTGLGRAGLWKPFWKNVEGYSQDENNKAELMIKDKWPIPGRPDWSPLTPLAQEAGDHALNEYPFPSTSSSEKREHSDVDEGDVKQEEKLA